jgi:hypothetical protein
VLLALHAAGEERYAETLAIADEGYAGRGAIDEAGFGDHRHMVELPSVDVTPAEYRRLLRGAQARS